MDILDQVEDGKSSPGMHRLTIADSILEHGLDDSIWSLKSIHGDQSLLIDTASRKQASNDEMQTPFNERTLPSMLDMTPGTFFAEKSGSMGGIGAKGSENRPIWFTPRKDEHGRCVDVIEDTPADRQEKLHPV